MMPVLMARWYPNFWSRNEGVAHENVVGKLLGDSTRLGKPHHLDEVVSPGKLQLMEHPIVGEDAHP